MPSGMQVFNTLGTLVADVTSPTLAFKAKQRVTIPSGAGRIRFVDFVFNNCEIPVFAFRPVAGGRNFFADITPVVGQPTQRNVRCYTVSEAFVEPGESPSYETNNTAALEVDVYHFDRPVPAGGAGYGMQLFDELGRCTFDSNVRNARVLRAVTTDDIYNVPGGVTPAVIPSHNWRFEINNDTPAGSLEVWYRECFKFNGSVITSVSLMAHNYINLSPTASLSRPNGFFSAIFVDVAGL